MNRRRDNGHAMQVHTLLAFTAVAAVAILSPGPATLLAAPNYPPAGGTVTLSCAGAGLTYKPPCTIEWE